MDIQNIILILLASAFVAMTVIKLNLVHIDK